MKFNYSAGKHDFYTYDVCIQQPGGMYGCMYINEINI